MKQIIKGREPKSLEEHRSKGGHYEGWDNSELRTQLLQEQGYICCYCMKRIPQTLSDEQIHKNFPSSKIAHILSQEKHPDQELNYHNLLIACNGNHGQPLKIQTCDTFQRKEDFHFNPSGRRNIEELIKYTGLGEIFSDDEKLNTELNEVLNLNTYDQKRMRAEIYKFYNEMIILEWKRRKGKEIRRRFYNAEKQKLLKKSDGKFPEFCMVGVYLLNKRLKKLD